MRLTKQTDYAIRTLVHCARDANGATTVDTAADALRIPRAFLFKIVGHLNAAGLIETVRGRNGGFRLARPADQITVAEVVRQIESDTDLVECFPAAWTGCPMAGDCGFKGVVAAALDAFMATLERHTIADISGTARPAQGAVQAECGRTKGRPPASGS